jgi:predicted nuclease of restriction endonuclease-like (RecB) superfamily
MRALAESWPEPEILQQLIAKLPWGHNLRVLDRIKDRPTRDWYLRAALEYGWSQDVLVLQIKSRLHERAGKALTNFQRELSPPESDMAEQILKDPYNFDFLTVTEAAKEREIERGLLTHLRDLLLELDRGFSFDNGWIAVIMLHPELMADNNCPPIGTSPCLVVCRKKKSACGGCYLQNLECIAAQQCARIDT